MNYFARRLYNSNMNFYLGAKDLKNVNNADKGAIISEKLSESE